MSKENLKKVAMGLAVAGLFMFIYNKVPAVRKIVGGQ